MFEDQFRNDLEPQGFKDIQIREDSKGVLITCKYHGTEAQADRRVPDVYDANFLEMADEPTIVRLRPE